MGNPEEVKNKGSTKEKIEKIYERTEVPIRSEGGMTEEFETRKGVRQGYVLSPLLFNVYIAEIDIECKKREIGGVEIGKERIWNLAYADDIVLLAMNKKAMEDMLVTFGNFVKARKLELSVERAKVWFLIEGGMRGRRYGNGKAER